MQGAGSASPDSFDYVILGGGTAGCVLANRLSADPKVSVLLVEAGGDERRFWINTPLGLAYLIGNPKVDWLYKSQPEPNLNGRVLPLPRGKVLGGSSSINGMVYVRGHAEDFNHWAQLGNSGWAWDDVLPYFIRSEGRSTALPGHGTKGEWAVSDPGVRWEALDAYKQAAVEAGIPATKDYNSGESEGVAYFEANIGSGVRSSTAKAFLRPVMNRPNLHVETNALVDHVTMDGRKATGAIFTQNGVKHTVIARREVIISGGAFGSPAILQRSGIGDAEHLKSLGIAPIHNLPGVGANLQDHWQIRIMHRLHNTRTLNQRAGSAIGKLLMGMEYLALKKGPLSAQPALLAAFVRSRAGLAAPDLQIHVSGASYDRVGGPMHPFSGITSSVCQLRPTSRGSVSINSTNPDTQPDIVHNFLETGEDQALAVESIRLVRRVMAQPAMARFTPDEISPKLTLQSDEELLAFARTVMSTTFHPAGTCRMGRDADAVVDDQLRVHGLANLRVVDASIMPTISSGNTAAPTVMIAEKAADLIGGAQRQLNAA